MVWSLMSRSTSNAYLFVRIIKIHFDRTRSMKAQLKKFNIGCTPTVPEALGPFYRPNAPVRDRVGQGYVLRGRVMSSRDCSPIAQAGIELWMAGPDGDYTDDYRATVIPNDSGEYRFECHMPPSYLRRPPHIHMRITAKV